MDYLFEHVLNSVVLATMTVTIVKKRFIAFLLPVIILRMDHYVCFGFDIFVGIFVRHLIKLCAIVVILHMSKIFIMHSVWSACIKIYICVLISHMMYILFKRKLILLLSLAINRRRNYLSQFLWLFSIISGKIVISRFRRFSYDRNKSRRHYFFILNVDNWFILSNTATWNSNNRILFIGFMTFTAII